MGGSEKVRNYADIIYGWSLRYFTYEFSIKTHCKFYSICSISAASLSSRAWTHVPMHFWNRFVLSLHNLYLLTGFFFSFHIWENLLSPFKKVVCIAAFEVLLSSYIIILDVIKFSLYSYSGSIEVLSYSYVHKGITDMFVKLKLLYSSIFLTK